MRQRDARLWVGAREAAISTTGTIGTAQAGTTSIGTAQAGTTSIGTAQAGTTSIGTAQAGTTSIGTAQAGTTSIGPVIVMGVTSTGKSTIGRALAGLAKCSYIEGDDLHPHTNIEKMSAGIPLDDDDRWPWLEEVGRILGICEGRHGAVATCSALKRSYRDVLRYTVGPGLRFVHLTGGRDLLATRMGAREGHYMPTSLLDDQIATLEPPVREDARDFDIRTDPDTLVREAHAWLTRGRR